MRTCEICGKQITRVEELLRMVCRDCYKKETQNDA